MAHPLTQHPPNVLGFGAPASMSPLGFGFGQPSHMTGCQSPLGGLSGFGSPMGAGPSTPLRRLAPPRVTPSVSPAPQSNKRTRQASPSPTSSPSPLGSPSLSSRRRDDEEENLAPGQRKFSGKTIKRVRKEVEAAATASDGPDVGLLLASLPPTSHLPILLELLNENPSLSQRVLRRIPPPPLPNCLETLERIITKVGKAAGTWEPQEGYVATRRWNRVEEQVSTFTKTASTYLKFFTTPSPGTNVEPSTIFHLLHALTAHIIQLLNLVPAEQPPAARPLLDLCNDILTAWTQWVSGLSEEVNRRGGMYSRSTVTAWADGLADLTRASMAPTQHIAPSMVSWATPISLPPPQVSNHPMVDGFRHALQPLRERFVNELGWLAN